MMSAAEKQRKCFEYLCPLYPKCACAAGSCCAVDDFFEDDAVSREECFDLPAKPFFREKKVWKP
ncbi:MAG: hypothetical protein ACOX8R_07920 [Bacillota bacterium]|jgi:hypothetical protein